MVAWFGSGGTWSCSPPDDSRSSCIANFCKHSVEPPGTPCGDGRVCLFPDPAITEMKTLCLHPECADCRVERNDDGDKVNECVYAACDPVDGSCRLAPVPTGWGCFLPPDWEEGQCHLGECVLGDLDRPSCVDKPSMVPCEHSSGEGVCVRQIQDWMMLIACCPDDTSEIGDSCEVQWVCDPGYCP